jgi:hypothetical protein
MANTAAASASPTAKAIPIQTNVLDLGFIGSAARFVDSFSLLMA